MHWWILLLKCFGGSYRWGVLVDLITEVCRWISCELCICFCHPWEAFCNNPSSWLTSSQLLHKQVMGDISTCLLMLVNKTLKGKEIWSVRFIMMMMQQWWVVSVPAYWHCWTKRRKCDLLVVLLWWTNSACDPSRLAAHALWKYYCAQLV